MRLFVALEIPTAVRANLASLEGEFHSRLPNLRWISEPNFHLTLKFIGHADHNRLDAIRLALAGIRTAEPVAVRVRGVGFFYKSRTGGAFFARINDSLSLTDLAVEIDCRLHPLGIPPESRRYTPHITLARFPRGKLPVHMRAISDEHHARELGSWRAAEFRLLESTLQPSGAEYTTLQLYTFAGDARITCP